MSFGRRMELMGRVRELARRTKFLAASEDAGDKMDAALLQAEIERVYVMWGVKAVAGLTVDGTVAVAIRAIRSMRCRPCLRRATVRPGTQTRACLRPAIRAGHVQV